MEHNYDYALPVTNFIFPIFMKPPLFILGCPRSGTTFLASLLKRASFGAPFESQFIIKYFKKLEKYGDLNHYENFSKLVRNILAERAVMQHKLEFVPHELFANIKEKTYSAIIDAICFRIAQQSHKHVTSWGDKTPAYTLHINILLKLFPTCKVIYITRDGRDVALSLMQQPWGPGNVYACAKLWKNYIGKKHILHELIPSDHILNVKYENILDEPEQNILNIYKFLGEECSKQHIQEMSKRTQKGNYNKWKKFMTEKEVKIFENIAANDLRAEGYETTYGEEKINIGNILYYETQNRLKHFSHLVKINMIDTIAIKVFSKEPFNE